MAKNEPAHFGDPSLPAWSLPAGSAERIAIGVEWPERVTRDSYQAQSKVTRDDRWVCECIRQQNLKTLRGAKSNAVFSAEIKCNCYCP